MRTVLRIFTFNAAGLLAVITLLARIRSSAWPLEWFTNLIVQILVAAIALLLVATAIRAKITMAICALAVAINGASVATVVRSDRDAHCHYFQCQLQQVDRSL